MLVQPENTMFKRSQEEWQALLDEQAQSGLTITAFCQQYNLNLKSFYNQRYQRNKRQAHQNNPKTRVTEPAFLPVRLADKVSSTASYITVRCQHLSIEFPVSTECEYLSRFIKGINT